MNQKLKIKEAAERYQDQGVTVTAVKYWIKKHHVKADKSPDGYLVDCDSLQAFLGKNPKRRGKKVLAPARQPAAVLATPDLQPGVNRSEDPQNCPKQIASSQNDNQSETRTNHAKMTDPKKSGDEDRPEVKHQKRFKRGPVRYAKDSMRHLEKPQLFEVIRWALNRIEGVN